MPTRRMVTLTRPCTQRPYRFVETASGRGDRFLPRVRRAEPRSALPSLPGFVGRQAELASLEQQLHQGPLVTVLGPGGSGKTFLVRQLASVESRTSCSAWVRPGDVVVDET